METAAKILKCKSKDLLIPAEDQNIIVYDAEAAQPGLQRKEKSERLKNHLEENKGNKF